MSFLTRTTTPLLRTGISGVVGRQSARAFSTSMVNRKIVPEPVKNAAKTVDRAVSDKIVDGIEIGREFAFSLNFSRHSFPESLDVIPHIHLS